MKFFLTALLRAFRKEMGRSPNPGERDMLKKKASEMEQSDKVIPFPPGGIDKVDPFKERPKVTRKELEEKIIGKEGTIQDMKEAMEPDGIMDVLLGKEKKITRDADELKPGFGDNIRDAYRKKGASREDAAKMIEAMDSPGGREATKIFEKELGMKL